MRYLALPVLLVSVAVLSANPAPEGKPTFKFEYAELTYINIPAVPKRVDPNGKESAAVPASVSIRWTTGSEEISVKGWAELAEKLKVELKKDGSVNFQRLQMLNALGASGWELMESQTTTTTIANPLGDRGGFGRGAEVFSRPSASHTMMFKKRVQ